MLWSGWGSRFGLALHTFIELRGNWITLYVCEDTFFISFLLANFYFFSKYISPSKVRCQQLLDLCLHNWYLLWYTRHHHSKPSWTLASVAVVLNQKYQNMKTPNTLRALYVSLSSYACSIFREICTEKLSNNSESVLEYMPLTDWLA